MTEEKDVLETVRELNNTFAFLSADPEKIAPTGKGALDGYYITIKDCICVKDVETTASSRILKGYKPVFDATVVEKIKAAGGTIIGKAVQDEFGFGSFCTNVGLGYAVPKNPHDLNRVTGGSSGGSAVATSLLAQKGIKHIAIAESTGGSIENPAAFCGVIGFCPTYGTVSRYGLLSYANSLDKIGIMATDVADVQKALTVIQGEDPKDSTSKCEKKEIKKIQKVAIIKESMTGDTDKKVLDEMQKKVALLEQKGIIVEEISLPFTFKYGIPAYYILATAEASTNLAALSGLRYGQQDVQKDEHFSKYFTRIRSEHFGTEAKRRIMLGTFTRMAGFRDAYYLKAAKIRAKVIEEYKKIFETYDLIISPTMPFVAPTFDDIEKLRPIDHYLADVLTVGPNLAGLPHMSYPIVSEKMPIGMMVIGNHYEDETVLSFGELLQ